jgi:hypothetical protein
MLKRLLLALCLLVAGSGLAQDYPSRVPVSPSRQPQM